MFPGYVGKSLRTLAFCLMASFSLPWRWNSPWVQARFGRNMFRNMFSKNQSFVTTQQEKTKRYNSVWLKRFSQKPFVQKVSLIVSAPRFILYLTDPKWVYFNPVILKDIFTHSTNCRVQWSQKGLMIPSFFIACHEFEVLQSGLLHIHSGDGLREGTGGPPFLVLQVFWQVQVTSPAWSQQVYASPLWCQRFRWLRWLSELGDQVGSHLEFTWYHSF